MNTEKRIRQALAEAAGERGSQAELAKSFEISPSTVTRWVDGGEIPPPMLKLLDFYFFGVVPPRGANSTDPRTVLDFDEAEWLCLNNLARREGVTVEQWIVGRIRSYLAWSEGKAPLQALPPPQALPQPKITGG